jgi:Fe-S cluster assembly ATPase SufC
MDPKLVENKIEGYKNREREVIAITHKQDIKYKCNARQHITCNIVKYDPCNVA